MQSLDRNNHNISGRCIGNPLLIPILMELTMTYALGFVNAYTMIMYMLQGALVLSELHLLFGTIQSSNSFFIFSWTSIQSSFKPFWDLLINFMRS